jgi:hypothetical protein
VPAKKKKPVKSKLKRGRPSLYQPDYPEQARKLCLLGLTNDELAEFFCVNVDTIHEWKKQHKDFSDAISAGKLKADADVAAKLHERAMGAEWSEDQAFKLKRVEYLDNGRKIREVEEVIVVQVRRAAPPDTPALSLWLRNRQPARWRDKPEPSDDDAQAQPIKVALQEIDARKPDAEPQ